MQQVVHIVKKELKDYFISPIAYIVIFLFLIASGILVFNVFFLNNHASLRDFFGWLPPLFAIFIPIITMRLFSEELNIGSYEVLVTLPVTHTDIVLGKFLAGVFCITAALVPTLSYPLCVSLVGELDWGPVVGGYVGAVLLAGAFTALGLFISSLTRNQIIAVIVSIILCIALILIDDFLIFISPSLVNIFGFLSADLHFKNIAKGIVDSRDILYFLSVIFLGVYGTHLSLLEKK